MSTGPRMRPVGDDEEPHYTPDPPTGGAIAGGVLAGTFMGLGLSFFGAWIASRISDFGDGTAVLFFALPVLVGAVLLLVPRFRRTGAGFVMGLGMGSIVGAGACGAFLAYLTASLGGA